ncbi:hypothetical protein ACXYRQ_00845 [Mycoplasma sp. 394]|uniref:hypothetical protein n=1 Tax=Mycoplasma sp. 6243 TaxID=3440865 RepID=UPI003EC1281F
MNYKQILIEQFGDNILDAKMVSNDFGQTLEITSKFTDLKQVEELSKQVSMFLNTQNWFKDEYNLEVLSKGLKTDLDINDLTSYINKEIKIKTIKSYESHNIFVVTLLEVFDDKILVRWNKKGQMRKVSFEKNNISSVELYIKF